MMLYIARHAWAGHYGDPPPADGAWRDDSERPLTAEGVERYRRVCTALAERGFAPQRVATSPYTRCVQTAELIAAAVGEPPVERLEALAPGAELDHLLSWTDRFAGESVAWVGHNPDVERLTAAMIGDGHAAVRFAKGSIAAIRFEGEAAIGAGVLQWHVTAKSLGL